MPAHPVLDNSKTWTWLLEHKPRELREYISNSPQQVELEYAVRRFTDRSVGAVSTQIGNTNFKAQVKIILAFWRGMPDWRDAYQYDISMIQETNYWMEKPDWFNFYLVTARKRNDDVLAGDKKRADSVDCPLFGGMR